MVTIQTGRGVFVAGTARTICAACRAVRQDRRRLWTLADLLRLEARNPWADGAGTRDG